MQQNTRYSSYPYLKSRNVFQRFSEVEDFRRIIEVLMITAASRYGLNTQITTA